MYPQKYDLNLLNKGRGTKFSYKAISCDDNGEVKSIKCFEAGLSKSLFVICQFSFGFFDLKNEND